jgi:predicted ATPase/DNA-binding winged helix-turn-helix (wHTH) protein
MAEHHPLPVEPFFGFDRFQVHPRGRLLLESGTPVRVGSRAFDILLALVERPGERIGKSELLKRVWPDTHVVEGNLKYQVAALRRVLRDGQDGRRFIETSQGQGYCFVGHVVALEDSQQPAPPVGLARQHNLPEQPMPLVGRDAVVAKLLDRLSAYRLLTISGPSGIGKTSVALAMAEKVIGAYKDGVWVVDFAQLSDPGLVCSAVAGVVGIDLGPGPTAPRLAAALRGLEMLLVLDNCMHVVDAAAALVAAILRAAPRVRILATSREPLRTEGERIFRLGPLETPPPSQQIGAAEALRYPAVQLFVELATASMDEFRLTDDDAPLVAEICRKLDGRPLSIELAAARVGVLGIAGLDAQLQDRLRVLTGGRRTALPRHQNMRAALDWSYDLLGPSEQTVFRRLAVFVGGFALTAAASVASDEDHPGEEIVRLVLELATKSLVVADMDCPGPRFRLLQSTRAYASERAKESGEFAPFARRHAAFYLELLEAAAGGLADSDEKFIQMKHDVANVRAALEWAFGRDGDPSLAARLAAASAELWFGLSLWTECRVWTGRALQAMDAGDRGTRRELMLEAAFGNSLMFTEGVSETAVAALIRANKIADDLSDADYRVRTLAALASSCHRRERFQEALDIGRRAELIAREANDPVALSMADWILGTSLLFLGEYRDGFRYAERTHRLASSPPVRRAHIVRLGRDGFVAAGCSMAFALWAQGQFDRSANLAREVLGGTATSHHPFTRCTALTWCGCIIPLFLGDLETADDSVAQLQAHAERYSLSAFHARGIGFAGQLCAVRGDLGGAEKLLRRCLDALHSVRNDNFPPFMSSLADVLARAGRVEESVATAEIVVERTRRTSQLWWLPEALRIKGETLLASRRVGAAKDQFEQALHWAQQQGALPWELRAATSLARLLNNEGEAAEAAALLASVHGRCTEGFETADVAAAKSFLDALRRSRHRRSRTQ